MVKTLVCGVKTITWGAGSCKLPGGKILFYGVDFQNLNCTKVKWQYIDIIISIETSLILIKLSIKLRELEKR